MSRPFITSLDHVKIVFLLTNNNVSCILLFIMSIGHPK